MFRSRDPASLIPPIIVVTLQGIKYAVSNVSFWNQVASAKINTRGWVMQERFMSPRALHFGAQQLFWECREKDAAEVNPDGLYVYSPISRFKSQYVDIRDRPTEIDLRGSTGHTYWRRMVETYSACALTFPSDKLIAVSAIAKQIAAVFQDEYVAGLWRRFLEADLLWHVDSVASDPSRYQRYVAPSWSWASVKGKVRTKGSDVFDRGEFIRVDGYELEYVTEDKTGAIRGGWLRLSGSLKRLRLLRWTASEIKCRLWSLEVNGLEARWPSQSDNPWEVFLDDPQEDLEDENEKGTLYCMPARNQLHGQSGWYLVALLLKLVHDDNGEFQRIGLARGSEEVVKDVLTSIGPDEEKLPCDEYKNGRHFIYIL
ncbi:hypothetical protein FDECE_6253 [Fusarium decemcellulare]|nr:hypothetical protein FDECE_6253 [Fusarium decemcellulare]